jgi:hypothetical protein
VILFRFVLDLESFHLRLISGALLPYTVVSREGRLCKEVQEMANHLLKQLA